MNENIILGSLLGDGNLAKHGKSKNARFRFKQSIKKIEYVEYLCNKLKEYKTCEVKIARERNPSKVNKKITHDIKYWDGTYLENCYFWTSANEYFTEMFNIWYIGKKKIPLDIKLNPEIISHWYMQDGSNSIGKNSKGIVFATNGFEENEVDFLCHRLSVDVDLNAKKYKYKEGQFTIRIKANSYFKFINMVKPYVEQINCFKYKIDISKAPKDKKIGYWDGPKLNYTKAKEIRHLYNCGYSYKELVIKFNSTNSTINKIINNKMYKCNLQLSGSADVIFKVII